jgi:hypothetical protein
VVVTAVAVADTVVAAAVAADMVVVVAAPAGMVVVPADVAAAVMAAVAADLVDLAELRAGVAAVAAAAVIETATVVAAEDETIKENASHRPVQLLVLAFGDRPLDESERAWLEGEVRAAFRERSAAQHGAADPAVILYEEQLDADVVQALEKKRGPAGGNGWRGFYDLAAVDPTLAPAEVLDAARFLADRSRRKVIVPLFVEAYGGSSRKEAESAGPRAPLADYWEEHAEKYEDVAKDLRRALHQRWGTAKGGGSMPPRGSA